MPSGWLSVICNAVKGLPVDYNQFDVAGNSNHTVLVRVCSTLGTCGSTLRLLTRTAAARLSSALLVFGISCIPLGYFIPLRCSVFFSDTLFHSDFFFRSDIFLFLDILFYLGILLNAATLSQFVSRKLFFIFLFIFSGYFVSMCYL